MNEGIFQIWTAVTYIYVVYVWWTKSQPNRCKKANVTTILLSVIHVKNTRDILIETLDKYACEIDMLWEKSERMVFCFCKAIISDWSTSSCLIDDIMLPQFTGVFKHCWEQCLHL